MKPVLILLLILVAASCAPRPAAVVLPPNVPRAIIIDTAPTEAATERVAVATQQASRANDRAQTTAAELRRAMERIKLMGEGEEMLRLAWVDAEDMAGRLAAEIMETQASLVVAEEEIRQLRQHNATLRAMAARNAAEVDAMDAQNESLRALVVVGQEARDRLVVAEDKIAGLQRWIFRGAITIAVMLLMILISLYFHARRIL